MTPDQPGCKVVDVETRIYQECRSLDGFVPIKVASHSTPGISYRVLVSPWGGVEENVCECYGYVYRGVCSHQQEAQEQVCGWIEGQLPVQTSEQRKGRFCPRCGGPTQYQIDVVTDDKD